MEKYCEECGCELPGDWDLELCEDCMNNFASSVILTDDFGVGEEDFL